MYCIRDLFPVVLLLPFKSIAATRWRIGEITGPDRQPHDGLGYSIGVTAQIPASPSSRATGGLMRTKPALFLTVFTCALLTLSTSLFAANKEKVLYSFNNNGGDGNVPWAGLISDGAGNLYGTTAWGGSSGYGTIFQLTWHTGGTWTEAVLYTFEGPDGEHPYAGLVFDAAGNLYGTTTEGGTYGYGTVFELTPGTGGAWTETVLHSFASGEDGYWPNAGLVIDATGNLYGTTQWGNVRPKYASCGHYGCGTVFELSPGANGTWTETVLYGFNDVGKEGSHGVYPWGGLILDAAGNLYGTTVEGGIYGWGTVFELTPGTGGQWTERVLHSFDQSPTDGGGPSASLIFDTAGNLYGTTTSGGPDDDGSIFKLTPLTNGKWKEKVLHFFHGSDGSYPYAGLIFDSVGRLYGTTVYGGTDSTGCTNGCGTVFRLTQETNGTWVDSVLHSFKDIDWDGEEPRGSLMFDAAGNLYGTTYTGGAHIAGTVFEITP